MKPFSSLVIGNGSLLIQCSEVLLERGHNISAVVTGSAEIRKWAESKNILAIELGSGLAERLETLQFDWLFSIANLTMIPQSVLKMAQAGAINFHDGPLPKYAGLNAPVWALLNGEVQHGITWHKMAAGVDEGDIVAQHRVDIEQGETAFSLNTKCFAAALDSFTPMVEQIETGSLIGQPQDLSQRSYFARDAKPDNGGFLDFNRTAEQVISQVQALDHGPYWNPVATAKILLARDFFHIEKASMAGLATDAAAGTVLDASDTSLTIATGSTPVKLEQVRTQDGKAVTASDVFKRGDRITVPTLEFMSAYTELLEKSAKTEAMLRGQLKKLAPTKCHLASDATKQPAYQTLEISLPVDMLSENVSALAALWAGRTSDGQIGDIAYLNTNNTVGDVGQLLAKWLPLRITSPDHGGSVESQIEQVQSSLVERRGVHPYTNDLQARDPDLSTIAIPDFGLVEGSEQRPITGTAVTLSVTSNSAVMHFDETRLSKGAAKVLQARFEGYLSAAANPDLPASELPSFPQSERELLLNQFNNTACEFDESSCVHQMFEEQAALTPNKTAVVFEAQSLTYQALNERANQLAHVLIEKGAKPDGFIGLYTHRSIDLLVGALAIQKAGAAYVPLDPAYPAARLEHYISDSDLSIIVSQSSLINELPVHSAETVLIDTDQRLKIASTDNPVTKVKADNLAYLIYTSGSTGTPKGVMVEHRNVSNFFTGMDERIKRNSDDQNTWLALTSLSFDISVLELFYTLARGFKLVISGEDKGAGLSGSAPVISETPMDFSLYYWGNDDGVGPKKYELLLEGAKFADKNGFTALWTPERHFHAFGGPYPNPSVTGAAVAAITENLSVRAGSCVAPLHHTARIAEEWAVIDNLTNGRAGLAIASGWQPDDFVLNPVNSPPDNKPAMTQAIKDLRRLWRGDSVEFAKKDGSMHAVVTQPRPVSKELPIWVTTAGNPATWTEAGELGANVLTHLLGQSIDEVAGKIKLYHAALRGAGHDPADFKVTLMLHSYVGRDRETVREIAREPMKEYLRAAAGLIKQYAWAFPAFKRPKGVNNAFDLNLDGLSDDELESILDFAFQRYFEDAGLFGTVEDCVARVESLKKIGVNEVACLIDYGISVPEVLEGLYPLAEVLRKSNQPTELMADDYSIAAQIKRHNVSHLQCTPSMAQMVLSDVAACAALEQVDYIMLGGEALSGTLVEKIAQTTSASVQNMYGPTETTIWSATEIATSGEGIVNIGTPIANTQLYVLNDDMQPTALGENGELFIGGAGVTRGYWQQDALTAERFIADPFAADGGRMYRTGDLVRRRLDGKIDFHGRIDHQVKLRGYRIELGEIETALEQLTSVQQAVAIVREDVADDKRLVAYFRSSKELAETDLRRCLAEAVPNYMVPSHFVWLESFPLTPNRKINRAALPAPSERSITKQDAVSKPAQGLAGKIAEIWSRNLGVEKIGAKDNFFDLGGHSLLAVQVHREIREKLDLPMLNITDIFRFPVLQALADHLGDTKSEKTLPNGLPQPTDTSQIIAGRAQNRSDAMSKRRAMRARRLGG